MTKMHKLPKNMQLSLGGDVSFDASDIEAAQSSGGNALPKFSMIAYTGEKIDQMGFGYPVVVNLQGMRIDRQDIPVRFEHSSYQGVGHTTELKVSGSNLTAKGVISRATPAAKEVVASGKNGFPWQASIGATVQKVEFIDRGKTIEINGRKFDGPLYVAQETTLKEVSFVDLGADDKTHAKVAASSSSQQKKELTMDFEQWLEANGFDAQSLNDDQHGVLQAAWKAQQTPQKDADDNNDDDATIEASQHIDDVLADIRLASAAETKRIAAIRKVCAGGFDDIEAQAIEEGWNEEKTELHVLRAKRPNIAHGGHRSDSDQARTGQAIEAAICLSAGLGESQVGNWYDERTMNDALSRDLRGAGLHTLFYDVINAAGDHVRPGQFGDAQIRAAFEANEKLIRASGGFSTISLPGILSNVANRAMLASYNTVQSVSRRFSAEADHKDFKPSTSYRLTAVGQFEKVGPDGELKHATLSEESFTNQVDTYGKMIALTRQMIIDDDLKAFLQIPRKIGRMSALKLEEAVFELLLSNPSSFFSSANANYATGASTALGIDSLTAAEQLFLDQTDSDGKPILISPKILLVPSSLKVTAEQLMKSLLLNETTTANSPSPSTNPHAGKFDVLSSPYLNSQSLSGSSALAWYLLADPLDVAAIEIAYLRGKRTPTIESGETDFNTLGMQWRGYFDFGVAMQDHRAAVKMKGEA